MRKSENRTENGERRTDVVTSGIRRQLPHDAPFDDGERHAVAIDDPVPAGSADRSPAVTIPVRFNGSAALMVIRSPSALDAPNLS